MNRSDEFERLYGAYYGRVYRFFLRHGVRDDARDLAQDVFVRIYQRMDQYRGEASEWTYLQTIARRILVDHVRMNQASKRAGSTISLDAFPGMAASLFGVTPDPLNEMVASEQDKQVQAEIQDLPKGMRTVLRLSLEGLSYREIAKAVRISDDAVKSRLRDAKRQLRERLDNAPREVLAEEDG